MSNMQIAKVQAKDRADKAMHINQLNKLKEKPLQTLKIQSKSKGLEDERSWTSKAFDAVIRWLTKF
jgi:hypothetical protein